MVCPLLSWLESEVRLQFWAARARLVILRKQPLPEDVWVVPLQYVPSIQTLGNISISTSMGGEVVHGILGSNILKYMENWKNLSLLVLILNSIFNDANKTTLTVSSIYVFRICLHLEQRAQIVVTRVKPRTEIAGDMEMLHTVAPGWGCVATTQCLQALGWYRESHKCQQMEGFCMLSSVIILKYEFVLNIFISLFVIIFLPFLYFCPNAAQNE